MIYNLFSKIINFYENSRKHKNSPTDSLKPLFVPVRMFWLPCALHVLLLLLFRIGWSTETIIFTKRVKGDVCSAFAGLQGVAEAEQNLWKTDQQFVSYRCCLLTILVYRRITEDILSKLSFSPWKRKSKFSIFFTFFRVPSNIT